jgi:hypothetical protein
MVIPTPGQCVRVIEIGPSSAHRLNPKAIGVYGAVSSAEPIHLASGAWLQLGINLGPASGGEHWFCCECRVEVLF